MELEFIKTSFSAKSTKVAVVVSNFDDFAEAIKNVLRLEQIVALRVRGVWEIERVLDLKDIQVLIYVCDSDLDADLDVIKSIRYDAKWKEIPLIVVTFKQNEFLAGTLLDLGVFSVISGAKSELSALVGNVNRLIKYLINRKCYNQSRPLENLGQIMTN